MTNFYTDDITQFNILDNQLGAFFNYNKSQNFQIGMGATYDMNLSRIRTAQANMRFKVGNYFFLTLRPNYDFVENISNFNFQIDPVLIK